MHTFAMLLKSFADDFDYAQRLIVSFRKFNADNVHLYCVVPPADLSRFEVFRGPDVTVLAESELGQYLVDKPVHGMRAGYINQEIVKLSFWELELTENYFCVDSDAEFIRPFRRSDFMVDEHTPYTVLVEDNELKVEPRYYREYWQQREIELRQIQDLVGLDSKVVRTCHGHQVFSAKVLRSFKTEFLDARGWSYADALEAAPYEFTWYNMWLQKNQAIEIHQREPLVKVFHNESQHLEYVMRGVTTADIARGYVALVINSNYARDVGVVPAETSKPDYLARYLSYGEVAQLIASKAKDTFQRRFQR
ncbi:hypothetical protein LBMAG15_20600 [Actinomycetes bacterium]|nr:hypothetical protein LBMAG15_20600 [Actinomycetes bacterium]